MSAELEELRQRRERTFADRDLAERAYIAAQDAYEEANDTFLAAFAAERRAELAGETET